MQLEIGIARREINPIPGTALFGYPSVRLGTIVADDLNATALVLRSGETLAAVLSLDLCIVEEDEIEGMRQVIHAATGIAPHNITIHCTHTHSGPVTVTTWGWGQKNLDYLASIRPRLAEAVADALSKLQPVRVGIGVGACDAGVNRREVRPDGSVRLGFNEWGPRDRDMTLVRFGDAKNTVATLVHFGAHPTSRGLDPDISRDWPGVMLDRLEKITDAPVIFINGAFGDVAPRTSVRGAVGDGAPAATEVGLRAASDATRIWHEIKEFRDVAVQTHSAAFAMPFAPLEPLEEAERQLQELGDQRETFGTPGANWNFWNAVREAHRSPIRTSRTFHQTLTSIGPIVLVPFAGEVFAEIALRLKHASPFAHTLVAGTTGGSHGYYVTRESRGRGGYEVWVARAYNAYLLADNIDDVLVEENLKLLRELDSK